MGKFTTCISNGDIQKRVPNEELDTYLQNGWVKGWPKMHQHMKDMSQAASKKLRNLKETNPEEYFRYMANKNKKTSEGLRRFWDSVDDEYIQNREIKKENTRSKWTEEEKQLYHNKMSESAKLDRANTSSEEYARRKAKEIDTKKKNGTMTSSKPEDAAYKYLLQLYPDVIRWYTGDNRYPFECDFYIPSKDCFIECNYHYTHGPHPFNPKNIDDIELLQIIKSKQKLLSNGVKNSYFTYEDVWTRRDVNKIQTAIRNKLNYYAVYSEDEFEQVVRKI